VAQMLHGGVPYFQIPTTLTAQVVQSIDPFCSTNYGSALNLFSIKYKRNLVWSDVVLIKSLPAQNLTSGLAHIIQLACQQNNGLFEFLEKNLTEIFDLNLTVIEEVVIRCCQNRIDLLRRHQGEPKNQQPKNFGEFFASILIESAQNKLKFGEALLVGMLIEAIIAFRTGIFESPYFERFYELLKQVPYYHIRSQIDWTKVIEYLNDKISHHKLPSLRLPQKFGSFAAFDSYKLSDFLATFELSYLD
jgi:3-dehydroquinate synthase